MNTGKYYITSNNNCTGTIVDLHNNVSYLEVNRY